MSDSPLAAERAPESRRLHGLDPQPAESAPEVAEAGRASLALQLLDTAVAPPADDGSGAGGGAMPLADGATGAGAGGSGGAPAGPGSGTSAARRQLAPSDFVALQRFAGNRAVAGVTAPRGRRPGPVVQREPKAVLEDPADFDVTGLPADDARLRLPAKPVQLEVAASGLDQAAATVADGIKDNQGEHIIIGVQRTLLIVYDKGGHRLSGRIAMKMPEGVRPDPGVFVIPPGGGVSRRVMVDPDSLDWSAGDIAGIVKEVKRKPGQGAPGATPPGATPPPAGDAQPGQATGGQPGPTPASPGGTAAAPTVYDLRKFMDDQSELDRALAGHEKAAQWFVVPASSGGSGKTGGAGSTTGFSGELAGDGTGDPPNRPPWPVNLDGPKMLPSKATGTWDAKINWAANGNDAFSSQVISAVGTDIHYRWELFDITQVAKEHEATLAAQAHQTRVAIRKADAQNVLPPIAAGPAAPAPDGTGGSAAPAADATASPATSPDASSAPASDGSAGAPIADDGFDKKVDDLTHAKSGTGTEVTGQEAANKAFKDDFRNLWNDTSRAGHDLWNASGDTLAERESNAQANLMALEMLPVSALVTAIGSSLRWLAELFAGEHKQMEVPFESEGTFLVRVVTTPRVMTDREGNKIIHASSVASRVVQVTSTEKMLREALDTPAADEAEANDALAKAQHQSPNDADKIKRLTLEAEVARLQNAGDPLALIDKQLEIKALELADVKKRWEGYAVGPILDVERQIDTLENRRKVYLLQEERRQDGNATLAPPTRLNASLISEVTGQRYPLVLSAGPMAMDGNRHHWKVLDATSEDSEGFDGYGATESAALQSALDKFGGKAQFGRGTIGVRVPQGLQASAHLKAEYRAVSQPAGWAIAKARIDDLVAVLAALGLLVTTAGTAAAVIGAVVAAARLIERYHNGTLRPDAGLVTDLLSVLGGTGVIAQEAAALMRAQRIGDMVVLMEEGVADASRFEEAATALKSATSIAAGIESANEVLNYAGLIWGNVTFVDGMLATAEAENSGAISHAEARRQRAMAIGGAINNNGMFVAGKMLHAHAANKAAAGEAKPTTPPGEPETPATGGEKPAAPEGNQPKSSDPVVDPEQGGGAAPERETHKTVDEPRTGSPDDARPVAGQNAGDTGSGGTGPAGGTTPSATDRPAVTGHGAGAHRAASPSATGAGAREALVKAAAGEGDLAQAARDTIGSGTWKGDLASALSKVPEAQRAAAERALVDARQAIVDEAWGEIQKEYPDLRLENAGTRSFGSDIDATVRPIAEATGTGAAIGDQVNRAGEAAQKLSDLLRSRVGGETDATIDTNIYSFIGEGRVGAPETSPGAAGAQQHVDLVVGLAEQMRGQSEAAFKAFEKRLETAAGDPRVAAEAKAVIGEARQFHDARQTEWADARARAKGANPKEVPGVVDRIARESLLAQKKGELASLLAAPVPDYGAITGKQAEINWFAPDAYATPSAFRQAVAHGQRLKGSAHTAAELPGAEVAAKYREAAAALEPGSPRAQQLTRDAALVESQQRLLDMTLGELKTATAESPMDGARVADLEARAKGLKDAIAAKAEPIVIGELLDTTMPVGKPSQERINESAAASAANMGMLEDHVAHAKDVNGKVKAAAKYAGRIAMAEFLGGMRPDVTSPIGRLIGEFVKSRWGILEDASAGILRDMFMRYALETGRGRDIVHDKQGLAIGVTDSLKAQFVDDVRNWARDTNTELQSAAIASKAFDNPTEANAGAATGGRPGSERPPSGEQPGGGRPAGERPPGAEAGSDQPSGPTDTPGPAPETGETEGPAKGSPDTGGSSSPNASGQDSRPSGQAESTTPAPGEDAAPAKDGAGTSGTSGTATPAAGAVPRGATPTINPPGTNQPFEFRLRTLAEGHAALRRLGQGDGSVLAEHGVGLPPDYTSQGREFGLALMSDGSFAIVQGTEGAVDWSKLPPGTIAMAHSHPLTEGRQIREPGTVAELADRPDRGSGFGGPSNAALDRVHVFPSAGDLVFCATQKVANHDVHTPYVHRGDGVVRTPTGVAGEIPISFNIFEARHVGNLGKFPVAEASVVAHDADGNVLWIGRMWGAEIAGDSMISFTEPSHLDAPDPATLDPRSASPAAGAGSGGDDEAPATRRDGSAPTADAVPPTRPDGGSGAGPDDAPATRREGLAAKASAQAGSGDGAIPAVPGGISITDDGVALWVRSRRDGNAVVRFESSPDAILVTDIYRKSLPQGSGSAMMAEGLKHLKVGPGSKLVIGEIINPETVASYKEKADPRSSLLGKVSERALGMVGLVPSSVTWQMRGGKLTIVMVVG